MNAPTNLGLGTVESVLCLGVFVGQSHPHETMPLMIQAGYALLMVPASFVKGIQWANAVILVTAAMASESVTPGADIAAEVVAENAQGVHTGSYTGNK